MLGVTGVALLGACGSPADTKGSGNPPNTAPKPVPAGQADPVRDRALSAEADLLKRYDAALALASVSADSGLTAKLTAIRAEHAAHAAAMKQGYTPPPVPTRPAPAPSTPPGSPTPSTSATTWSPPAPTDAKTALAALAGAEQDAASARTADILAADGATAMLLASIAASESGHAALLLGGIA
jgi:hypothetical protein